VFATLAFLLVPAFDRWFAWDVLDRRSGITLGTGFLMRAVMFWFIINAASFGQIRWLLAGNTVYAVILLGATMVHGNLFKWRRPIAVIWLYLYIEEPVWMLTLVPEAQAAVAASGVTNLAGDPVNTFLVAVLWIEALVMLVAGISLYLPNRVESIWPWKPDTVSGIVISGFPLMWVGSSISLALSPSWAEAVDGVLVNIIWLAAVFLSLLIWNKRFDLSKPVTRVFAGVNLALIVLLVIGYVIQ
jgi:hypothetical protein